MKLYAVTFRADVDFGKDLETNHEVILSAENSEEAEKAAKDLFIKYGGWTKLLFSGQWITQMTRITLIEMCKSKNWTISRLPEIAR